MIDYTGLLTKFQCIRKGRVCPKKGSEICCIEARSEGRVGTAASRGILEAPALHLFRREMSACALAHEIPPSAEAELSWAVRAASLEYPCLPNEAFCASETFLAGESRTALRSSKFHCLKWDAPKLEVIFGRFYTLCLRMLKCNVRRISPIHIQV